MTNSRLIPLYVNTSLDTHLAIAVPPGDTVASVKGKFAVEHEICFSEIGRVDIEAFMTRMGGKDYHLSDSLPISAVLQTEGASFLEALVVKLFSDPLQHPTEPATLAINSSVKKKKRKRNQIAEPGTSIRRKTHDDCNIHKGDTRSGSHEGGNTKKKEGEKYTLKLSSCHECNTSCKNHTSNVILATKEGAIAEMAAELEGSCSSSNVFVCKELVPPCKKNLLVLDINGLLADITTDWKYRQYADFEISGKLGFKRPFCVDFLEFCFANFEVGVWSSRMQHNLETAVSNLFGEMENKLLFCWDQSKCTATSFRTVEKKPLFLKELNKLWEKVETNLPWEKGRFTPSNTLLVDDSPCKALCNPPYTAIFPCPFTFMNKEDNSLDREGDIRIYLEKIAVAKNIPEFVEENPFGQPPITSHQHPQWEYYCGILEAMKRLLVSN